MCVANLNVSLQPCSHRWYTLVRPCSKSTNLSNCSHRVRLEGWETRVEHCPWCATSDDPSDVTIATHKLFGGTDFNENRRRSDSTAASTDSLPHARTNSISAFSNKSSGDDASDDERIESERAVQNQLMNRRIDAYIMNAVPDEIPSRRASIKPTFINRESSDSFTKGSSLILGRWGSTKRKKNRRLSTLT